MSKRKISSYFGIERGKTIDQDEKKKKNEFTHEEQSREENDAQLPNSKPRNFHTKWLNDHKWLRFEKKRGESKPEPSAFIKNFVCYKHFA